MKKKALYCILIILIALVGCESNNDEVEKLNKIIEEKSNLIKVCEAEVAELKEQIKSQDEKIEGLETMLKVKSLANENIIERNKELKSKNESRDYYFKFYESHFNPTIPPEEAERIIKTKASKVIDLLKEKNMEDLLPYIHPTKGVRFTPYTTVTLETDKVFDRERIRNFFKDETKYFWGYFDGSGDDILLKSEDYYDRFIYDEDYVNAENVGYNIVLSSNNNMENQFAFYHNSIIVEYYFSGFNPDYVGMDWKSLRIVFEKENDEWYLVGIIHNQWTI